MILLFLLLSFFSVPVAYMLLWMVRTRAAAARVGEPPWCDKCGYSMAGLGPLAPCPECGQNTAASRSSLAGLRKRDGAAPWCGECGYSMAGLAVHARCPECAGVRRTRPWPAGWVAPACVAVAQAPSLIGYCVLNARASHGGGPEAWFSLLLLALLVLPAAAACWSAWVVTRAGVRWLSVCTLSVLAGLPFLIECAALLSVGPEMHHGGQLGRGISALILYALGPLVMVLSLSLFTVAGLLTAAGIETRR